ncbi:hypothetical protein PVAP13_4NG121200 [Panicum virgatum]|uniref:Uncharacterized protein n=1 Tax=Panicum virgatum TaxID=38727 RepID=A0A8T0TA93_PANVG|nr:hypothetical protein PVAP13_4NG121200 [Panicum virgatum]
MAATGSSSSQRGRALPLINCPECQAPVAKHRSKNDNIYYRCSNKCGQFWFEAAYELYLRDNQARLLDNSIGSGHIQVVGQAPDHVVQGMQQVSGELKIVALDLKMQLADIKLEIGNVRNEIKELRDEFRKGNRPIVVGNAAIIFVAMLVVVMISMYWKN